MKKSIFLFFAAILCAMTANAWGYKTAAGSWDDCSGSSSKFKNVTMKSGKSQDVVMLTNVGDGLNILQNDCDGQALYCKWTKTSGDIFRGTARWNNGLYCDETVVIPGGIVYIKVGSGAQVQMTAGADYTYTADVTFSTTGESYTISGGTVNGATIENQSGMPAGGKPSTLTMSNSYTSTNSGSVHIVFDLKTNKVTETAESAPEPEPVADVTIYFVNTKSWSSVNAYVWDNSENVYKAWPGEAMTSTGDKAHGYDVYSYTFPETYTNCIFNGNGQTEDLTVNAGQYYDIASKTWYATLAEVPNPTPAVMETVYFINTGNWGKVNAYAWTSSNNGWPGAEMTQEAEQIAGFDVYSFTAEQGQWANLIFNNGEGTQTGDLTWEAGKYYAPSKNDWYDDAAAAEAGLAAPVVNTYTVVGSSAPLFGETWATGKVENDMTLVEGTKYELVKTDVSLTVGEILYKVAVNHAWDEAYPGENATLNISEAGKYTVTFTFDSNTKAVNATAELTEAAVVLPTVGVKGAWDGWTANTTLTGDNTSAAAIVNITTADIYEFGLDVDGNFQASGATIDKANNSTVVTTNAGNMKLTANVLGEYTFTWTYETNTLTVTYPAGEEVEIAKKYYIAGSENLTGFDWKENGLQLTKDGDLYKHTFSELNAGEYEFKITDGTWTNPWGYSNLGAAYEEVSEGTDGEGNPNGNIKFVTEEAKNITVIFDATAGKITIDGLTEKAPVEKHYYLIGTFNEWTLADANYELALVDGLYKKEVTLAKDAEFKVNQGDWDASWGKDNLGDKTYEELEGLEDGNLKMLEEKTFTIIFNPAENLITFEGLTEIIPTYTVAGDNAAVFGTEWDAENYENDMTLQNHDGTYVWTKPAVYLTGDVEFKVIKNQNWETAWPSDNYVIDITESAFYNLTIYYNPANNDITVVTNKLTAQTGSLTLDGVMLEETDFEGMALLGLVGNSSDWTTEVGIYLENYTGEDKAYNVYYVSTITYNENYSMDNSVSGQLTQTTGVDGLRTFTGTLNVAFEGYDEETEESVVLPYQLTLTLVEKSDAATVVVVTDATVDLSNGLTMTGTWTDLGTTYPVLVTVPGFVPSVASAELEAAVTVGGDGDDDPWLGFVEGPTTVTVEDGVVEVTGVLENTWAGVKLDVTISGTLPAATPDYTRDVTNGEWGTICLPYASSSFTGATFYEVSSLVVGEGLWLDQLAAGEPLVAGKPYIFQATATEITVTYKGEAEATPVAGANGLTGTFDGIAAGGVLENNYIIAENKVWVAGSGASLAANRAYINAAQVPDKAQAQIPGRRRVIMGAEDEGTSTGFENITTTDKAVKIIENGQLIIIRDGVKYNAQGQKF